MTDIPPKMTRPEQALFDHLMQMLEAQARRIDAQQTEIETLRAEMADLRRWANRWQGVMELATRPSPSGSPVD